MLKKLLFALVAVAVIAAVTIPSTLSAHEGREVSGYNLVVGFINEPAFEGQANAATIRISKAAEEHSEGTEEGEHGHGETVPVTGTQGTLQVAVTHLATNTSKTMPLRAVFGQDGLYAADFVPTAPGAYSFRFFGTIEGVEINETFTSGPGTFNEVQAARDIQFPVQLVESRELQSAVQGVQSEVVLAANTADSADSRATTAMTIGIIGLVAGVAGLGVGGYATMAASRRK